MKINSTRHRVSLLLSLRYEIQYLYTLMIENLYRYTTSHASQNLNVSSIFPIVLHRMGNANLTSYTS